MSDWIEHKGTPMPEHASAEDIVIARFRDGSESMATSVANLYGSHLYSSLWHWDFSHPADIRDAVEIVAYKVVSE